MFLSWAFSYPSLPYSQFNALATFRIRASYSFLLLLKLLRAKLFRFGTICTFQMICDIAKLFVTTAFALIPDDLSPGPHSEIAITVCVVSFLQIINIFVRILQVAEIFYFSSCLMHVLFAIHRLIFIVFPNRRDAWTSYTVHAIAVCVAFASFKSFLPRWLGKRKIRPSTI